MDGSYCPMPKCAWNYVTKSGHVPGQVLLSWAVGGLHLLNQVLGCSTGTAWSPGLHRGCIGCHRHRCRGDLWDSWYDGDSWVVCGFGATGVVGVTGKGCASCAGLVGAGCGADMWGLAGAWSVAVVVSGSVSVGLTLHSCRCHLVHQ